MTAPGSHPDDDTESETVHTRSEAIAWLHARGYVARARDFCLGEAICIAKRLVSVESDISVFEPTAIYVYPLTDQRWAVVTPIVPSRDVEFRRLQEAVDYALVLLEARETATDS